MSQQKKYTWKDTNPNCQNFQFGGYHEENQIVWRLSLILLIMFRCIYIYIVIKSIGGDKISIDKLFWCKHHPAPFEFFVSWSVIQSNSTSLPFLSTLKSLLPISINSFHFSLSISWFIPRGRFFLLLATVKLLTSLKPTLGLFSLPKSLPLSSLFLELRVFRLHQLQHRIPFVCDEWLLQKRLFHFEFQVTFVIESHSIFVWLILLQARLVEVFSNSLLRSFFFQWRSTFQAVVFFFKLFYLLQQA